MFSIANSAAENAARVARTLPPPKPRRVPQAEKHARRNSGSSKRWLKQNTKEIPSWPKSNQPPNLKPILKSRTGPNSCSSSCDDTELGSSYNEDTSLVSSERSGGTIQAVKREKLSVSFSTVEIREYIIQLGDSPFADGAPIGLSNERQGEFVVDALKFDESRCRDRRKTGLRLSSIQRSSLLLSLGYSLADIAEASIETHENRRKKMLSLQNKNIYSSKRITEVACRMTHFLLMSSKATTAKPKGQRTSQI